MNIKIDECSQCENNRPIVNKKYRLCEQCNKKRLGTDSKPKSIIPKKIYKLKQTPLPRSTKPVKRTTAKQGRINSEMSALYRKMAGERENVCSGCGATEGLTNSHLVPRSQNKSLELDERNIVYHCMTCHQLWEHGSVEAKVRMFDYDQNMQTIREIDPKYYRRITKTYTDD